MSRTQVHKLSKSQIKAFAIEQRNQNKFYDISRQNLNEAFFGSLDRYCDILFALRESPRVLDAGSAQGLLVALLKMLGHEVYAVDFTDFSEDDTIKRHEIPFQVCNIEADTIPFESDFFDAVCCCQVYEHFTHTHLAPTYELKRILRPGGILEIDVPNAVSFRNRSRMLRGKHITYDYKTNYLYQDPEVYKGREYYPMRHNREFTKKELELLLRETGFSEVEVKFIKSRRYRTGIEQIKSIGTSIKDAVPSFRKTLMAFAVK